MAIRFKSLRSSSSGNCLLLYTDSTKILIDCGLGSMANTRQTFDKIASDGKAIDAVIISHIHCDHISHYPLRIIENTGTDLWAFGDCYEQMKKRHFGGSNFTDLRFNGFYERSFSVGDIFIEPFRVPHQPNIPTFGFVFKCKDGGRWKKIVCATDFSSSQGLLERFADADFIFLESNYDNELLKKHFNPNSKYHLSNPNASRFLCEINNAKKIDGRKVMLGHLSKERNTSFLAVKEVMDTFAKLGENIGFELKTASAHIESEIIEIG